MKLEAPVSFAADHPAFPGHFPALAIVPGVLLLDAVLHLHAEAGLQVTEIASAKFLRPVGPGQSVTVSCDTDAGRGRFDISSGAQLVASGRLVAGEK
ncbi:MAG: putative acyl-coenzyme synthetase/AMP-(fatty) acid ligase [Ramlibacter sp.]|jgi:3-hydroxyacyl-[acyl-carrier-protein] dehydratase|nr:putative acyl-coenzyme synthetase/AMP-(fatty) acid ligase [Ramlibacter sp.]